MGALATGQRQPVPVDTGDHALRPTNHGHSIAAKVRDCAAIGGVSPGRHGRSAGSATTYSGRMFDDDLRRRRLGAFCGVAPVGKAFRVPIIAVCLSDGDRVVDERTYVDSASLVTRIGRGEILAPVGKQ